MLLLEEDTIKKTCYEIHRGKGWVEMEREKNTEHRTTLKYLLGRQEKWREWLRYYLRIYIPQTVKNLFLTAAEYNRVMWGVSGELLFIAYISEHTEKTENFSWLESLWNLVDSVFLSIDTQSSRSASSGSWSPYLNFCTCKAQTSYFDFSTCREQRATFLSCWSPSS